MVTFSDARHVIHDTRVGLRANNGAVILCSITWRPGKRASSDFP